jgi:MFS family permease
MRSSLARHADARQERPAARSRAIDAAPRRSRLAKPLTLVAMSLGYGVVQLDVTIVNTALSSIGAALGGGVAELQWVVSAYTIAFAALILSAGALGDRLGARRVFMSGFVLFTAASLGCALAPSATLLIAARAIQGVGAAILVPNSLALLNHAYPDDKERGRAVGMWAAGASLTPAVIAAGALISAAGCAALLGIADATPYWAIGPQLATIGGGLGLLVPPLTSALLGSVDKSRSGVAAGVLNATRQTGSVLGVALFGSLLGAAAAFTTGVRIALVISIVLQLAAAAAIMFGRDNRAR